ncbi:quinone-dependent dihydroorotate dehydrogenase [Parvibaculum sp.]|jgi:dihydroorotate dehydrogenase|uniref:quinone-dependent dihydroorotate dehydrogenase n=1 Tax=Parvibaculum sp. TaxID=2024848 RepID=UPI001AFF27EE|nr:quinone-dependent dihydroorotate dehydrogenase [Parvibaculum sp.]MBO6635132.1 quinone-dependent dihydroorotate dehydrogenase [Parvibaculum sp.]MBO6678097.1 quinone-dependent dihydroorotate dehydrogenase [Parvibaculum sp.]MBO6684593.1 quinone-dependent dihydroorotate dehydrogenase [Parvibaculum sp.]MBO6906054.1 quinone-dependent dihydroorotate dehydrogenase [Parvibaculum sp.]
MDLFPLVRPFASIVDPETAHRLTIRALRMGLGPSQHASDPVSLGIDLFGLHFENPVGIAAGFDKNGEVPDAMLALGMGFAEVGTVTPLPQSGNPRPRIFRLPVHRAVINRLGFNNEGHAVLKRRLLARRRRPGIVGVNIGANKDAADRVADYEAGIRVFDGLAAYFTVNISSPNTPGLRALQNKAELQGLVARVLAARRTDRVRPTPVLLKIAPDLNEEELNDIAEVALAEGLDGLIVSNTTIAREGLVSGVHAGETGGLSGAPLFTMSTGVLREMYRLTGGRIPLVGVGGIMSGDDAYAKIRAGASLVQLYSALTYEGPALVSRIKQGIAARLAADGFAHLKDAVGADVEL